jgi:phosphopantetheinyl transferase (holo-ACP synthase)
MLVRKETLNGGGLLGIWKIEESEHQLLNLLHNRPEFYDLIREKTNVARRCETLSVRALLQEMAGEGKFVVYDANGKPALDDGSWNISISHTRHYAAILLHPAKTVGIDIEQMGDKALQLSKRFMSPKELKSLDKGNDVVVSLLHWSAKETVYKILDRPGIDFAKEMFICPFLASDGMLKAEASVDGRIELFEISFEVSENYVLTYSLKQ